MWHIASQRDEGPAPVRSDLLLLVGEAPSRTVGTLPRPSYALTGRSGRRLAELAGVPWVTYLRRTERTNLLEDWPGATWPAAEARMGALRVLPQLAERRTILVGARVARAFGLTWDPFSFVIRLDALVPDADVAMIPHPSGRSRWWNDARNVERARAFLQVAFAPAAGP
jgi:hypothetical protein